MSRVITVECHSCSHHWLVDLDKQQDKRLIYRGEPDTRQETYAFKCPKCGTDVVVDVTVKSKGD